MTLTINVLNFFWLKASDIFPFAWFPEVEVNQNTGKNHHSNLKLKISKLCYCWFSQIKITSEVELSLLSRGTHVYIYLITRGTSESKVSDMHGWLHKTNIFRSFSEYGDFFPKTPLLIYHACRYHSQIVNPLLLHQHWTLPFHIQFKDTLENI